MGYIVLSEDGTAAYRISGGLNGGSTQSEVIYDTMVEFGLTLVDITEGMLLIFQSINMMAAAGAVSFLGSAQIALAGVCIGVSVWSCIQTFKLFDAYMDGNEEAGEIIVKQTIFDVIFTVGLSLFSELAKPILSLTLKNKLVKSLGADVVEELLANGAKLEDISKLVTNLKKLGLSDEVISMFAKNFGDTGLDWLRKARGLGASPDVLKQLSQMDGFADKMDEIFELMKGSSKSADDVAECLIKNGDEAIEIIRKYGDDAVDAIIVHGDDAVTIIGKYGDDAVDRLKQGKTPDEIEKELGESSKTISQEERNKISSWIYTPSDELYLKYKDVFDNPKYFDQVTGEIHWPDNDGFKNTPMDEVLQPGTRIDRYGDNGNAQFFSPNGTPWSQRSLPPGSEDKKFISLEVLKEIPCSSGEIAPWFNQPGGGIQYYTNIQIESLTGEMVDATLENLIINKYVKVIKE